jgi:hypothetical protein
VSARAVLLPVSAAPWQPWKSIEQAAIAAYKVLTGLFDIEFFVDGFVRNILFHYDATNVSILFHCTSIMPEKAPSPTHLCVMQRGLVLLCFLPGALIGL